MTPETTEKLAQKLAKQITAKLAMGNFEAAHIDKFGGAGIPAQIRLRLIELLTECQGIACGLIDVPACPGGAKLQADLKSMCRRREAQRYAELAA